MFRTVRMVRTVKKSYEFSNRSILEVEVAP
jgi:hypothetical protein